jgi:hypothetical protein
MTFLIFIFFSVFSCVCTTINHVVFPQSTQEADLVFCARHMSPSGHPPSSLCSQKPLLFIFNVALVYDNVPSVA